MKDQFVPYPIAKELFEKGFNENCLAYYNPIVGEGSEPLFLPVDNDLINFREVKYPCVKAPLWQQVTEWLRDKHRVDIKVECTYNRDVWYYGFHRANYPYQSFWDKSGSYNEALEKAIKEVLNLIITLHV